LRARFKGKPEMVVAYFRSLADEIRVRLANLGVRSLSELTGWYDRLSARSGMDPLMVVPISAFGRVAPQQTPTVHAAALEDSRHFRGSLDHQPESQPIRNSDRSVGAGISGEVMRRRSHGDEFTAEISREFHGSAGQSFGAFLAAGLTLKLTGEANDYVGKGLSGGTISISAGSAASRRGDVLAGNTVLYGATSGQLYIAGRAGERFAVRNSGALAVVEGLGQHGCEYMTGGVALVLGSIGMNFGSGMTGGLAYILRSGADEVVHPDFVNLAEITDEEEFWLRGVLEQHVHLTDSPCARRMLMHLRGLPLLRVQPIHFQGTIEDTWRPLLAGLPDTLLLPSNISAQSSHAGMLI
jgi:glutamate synthase domain-containing protein 3